MKYTQFYKAISTLSNIPENEWQQFEQLPIRKQFKKNTFFLKAQEIAETFAFIEKGAFRIYYITKSGEEFNQVFKIENDIVGGYASLLLQQPTTFYIEALEDSSVLTINFKEFQNFFERHICWERLGRKIAEIHFVTKEIREQELLTMTAKERYIALTQNRPELIERVAQHHLASYLGITPTSFSRILREIKRLD